LEVNREKIKHQRTDLSLSRTSRKNRSPQRDLSSILAIDQKIINRWDIEGVRIFENVVAWAE